MWTKLTSRKLWISLIAVLFMYLATTVGGIDPDNAWFMISPLLIYIFGESSIDFARQFLRK